VSSKLVSGLLDDWERTGATDALRTFVLMRLQNTVPGLFSERDLQRLASAMNALVLAAAGATVEFVTMRLPPTVSARSARKILGGLLVGPRRPGKPRASGDFDSVVGAVIKTICAQEKADGNTYQAAYERLANDVLPQLARVHGIAGKQDVDDWDIENIARRHRKARREPGARRARPSSKKRPKPQT
jgi:hypothetical protein